MITAINLFKIGASGLRSILRPIRTPWPKAVKMQSVFNETYFNESTFNEGFGDLRRDLLLTRSTFNEPEHL